MNTATLIEADAPWYVERPNLLMAQKVEAGIIVQEMLGTASAAKYLASGGVALDVAMRVLTRPRRRRAFRIGK